MLTLTMKRTFISAVVFLSVIIAQLASSQEVWILAQGGQSSYGSLYVGPFGGPGGGDRHWKLGPILGVGVRLKTSNGFSVDGTVEYSTQPYDPEPWSHPVKDDPRNTIVDINALGRVTFGLVGPVSGSFAFGGGYWHQTKDPIEYDPPYSSNVPKGETASGVGFVLGLGLGVELADRFDLYFDGNIRCREYVTPVLQLGLAFRVQ